MFIGHGCSHFSTFVTKLYQSSEIPVRSKSLKHWRIPVKYFFSLIHNWPNWFKMNRILQHQIILQNLWSIFIHQWNYFQSGCIDKQRSSDFSLQPDCIPFEAFASKHFRQTDRHSAKLEIMVHILLQNEVYCSLLFCLLFCLLLDDP